jgi:predicted Co/Zn/Cd cation transporter (cation efflux family)
MVITKSSAALYAIYLSIAGVVGGVFLDQEDIIDSATDSLLDEGITGIFILVLLVALYIAHKTNKDQAHKFQKTVEKWQEDTKEIFQKEMEENAKVRETLTKINTKLDERLPKRK